MYYIAGYIAKCLAKEKCQSCNDLFPPGNVSVLVSFEHEEDPSDDPAVGAKTEFFKHCQQMWTTKTFRLHLYLLCSCIIA